MAEAVRGATWPIRHPKPSVGFFLSLQVADCIIKNSLMVSAQAFLDRGGLQITGLHPDNGREVLTVLEAYAVTCIYFAHPFPDELYLLAGVDNLLRGAPLDESVRHFVRT